MPKILWAVYTSLILIYTMMEGIYFRCLLFPEIVLLASKGDLKELEERLRNVPWPETVVMEEAMLTAISKGNDDCIPLLVEAGVRRLDCALHLAIQLERIKTLALLLLCKAAIAGDANTIHTLLFEPFVALNAPWYMAKVHKILSQHDIELKLPITVSVSEKNYDATKELLLRTEVDMGRKKVDWGDLKLTLLDSSWIRSIAPWVVSLTLDNNDLRTLPHEMFTLTQLRRLDLSQNILEDVPANLLALPNLEYLSLGHNRLKDLPETTHWSASLLSLDLSDNLLTTLPQGIQHSNIEILNLSNNQFRVVPKFLCRVRTLTSLDLTSMQISVLPKEIENLNRLVHLNVSNHVNHVDLPSEQQSGIKGKLRVQTRITKPCNHVKLILLCHSDMAKTVMLSRLKPQLNLPPNQPLPEIDTFQWAFKPLFTRKMFASPKLYFNTWLIGTHYSCRSIYPCFFTTSALYVIVWDLAITADLSEQIKPYVDLLVRYVPAANVLVIAVLPEECKGSKNQQTTETLASRLNNFFSRPSYKSLRLHSVVLMVIDNPMLKEGQAELKQSLYSVAQQMITNGQKFVDRHVSETFFSLIPVLERERQTFTSQNKPGVLEEGTLWTLFDQGLSFDPPDRMELQSMVEFLREAGFLLHFEDPNDRLDQYYFTRPNWLFNTLLYIVRRTHAMEHRSCLFMSHQELCSSLADVSCSQDISKLLIRLMIRYSMAIPTKEDQYLLTFLLPHSSPSSDVLYCGTLRRQFAPQQQNFSIDLPVDLWSKLLCSIVSNLHQITNESELKTDNEIDKYTMSSSDIFAFTSSNGDEYDSKTNSHQAEIAFREGKERKETSTPVQSASLTKLHSELLNLDCTQRDISQLQLASSCNSHCNNSPENIANEGSKVTPVNLKGQLPQSEAIMLDVKAENTMTEEPEKSEQLIDGQGECKVGTSMLSTASIHKVSPVHFTEKSKKDRIKRSLSVKPISIEEGVEIWDCGIVYNKKGVKFSVFPCISNMLTVEKRGIEICCTRDSCGYVIMARLCWLVQQNLEEQYPHLLSTDTPLQNHELTQVVICPTCLEMGEQNPSCFLIEVCVRALRQRNEYNCINHRETIPFRDLTPDYLLLNFPSDLHLTNNMFDYNEAKPFHKGKHTILHDGRFEQQKVAVKMFYQIGSSSVTFPLSCIRKETDMLISLKHPNIVKMFGFCLDPICVLEEKAPLGNLLQMLLDTDRHRISRTVCFHISCQIASALSYLHRRDIVYRTLKASSVLLWSLDFNCDPSVKLASFERAAYQSPRGLMGKTTFSSYPAPEMLRYSFKEEYTEKVDIYSFGILLYELIKRQQCCGGTQSDNHIHSHKPNLSGVVATSYNTIVKLIEMCLLEDFLARPSADDLLQQLSEPLFQCYIASQVLRDCVSVRGYCFVPSVRQIWILCECMSSSERDENEGTEVFILDTVNLTVQGSLDFKERPTAMSTVDNKVWIGMADLCVHVYDTTTFRFTDRFYLDDLATVIADNDFYVFVGQVNGQLKCYPKLDLHRRDSKAISVTIGAKAIMAIVTVGDSIWLGCGNELVVMTAEEELLIRHRAKVCKPTDQVYRLTVSCHTNTVWCLVKKSHSISGWNTLTFQQKHTVDLREQLNHIFSELQLNYDPSIMYVVSLECVNDTIWVGLSCGVIMILTDNEQPKEIIHFKAHIGPTKCLMKIPHSSELHQHHAQSLLLSGGLGADSSLSDTTLERNRVVMLWHALSSSEFDTVVKRHNKYRCN